MACARRGRSRLRPSPRTRWPVVRRVRALANRLDPGSRLPIELLRAIAVADDCVDVGDVARVLGPEVGPVGQAILGPRLDRELVTLAHDARPDLGDLAGTSGKLEIAAVVDDELRLFAPGLAVPERDQMRAADGAGRFEPELGGLHDRPGDGDRVGLPQPR